VKEIDCVVASPRATCVYRCFLAQSPFTALTTNLQTVRPNHVYLTHSLSSSVINNQTCRGKSHHPFQNPSRGYTSIRSKPTKPSTVKPDQLLSQPIRDIYKLRPGSVLVSSPHLVSDSSPGQIENQRPQPHTSRPRLELDHTPHPRSDQAIDGSLYPILNVGHVSGEDASQGIATFIDQVNKFTSRLTGPVPDDLTALIEYQQDSLVIMRMVTREVVGAVERRLVLGREEINDEEGFQTWSNGMLALFEMIVQALYCRIRELKYLVHRKGEVVEGIIDGMMVLSPVLLHFDVTDERSLIVEDMLGETYGIHVELMKLRQVRGRLREVIDQWYEASTWIDPREERQRYQFGRNGK
jgi:hypothetical protein